MLPRHETAPATGSTVRQSIPCSHSMYGLEEILHNIIYILSGKEIQSGCTFSYNSAQFKLKRPCALQFVAPIQFAPRDRSRVKTCFKTWAWCCAGYWISMLGATIGNCACPYGIQSTSPFFFGRGPCLIRLFMYPLYPLINQSINRSINQPISQSMNQFAMDSY